MITMPLEDWYEELADETLDPLYQLIKEEDEPECLQEVSEQTFINQPKQEITMSKTIGKSNESFLDFMRSLNAVTEVYGETKFDAPSIPTKPYWLEIKGPVSDANKFSVTAGIVAGVRKLGIAIRTAQMRYDEQEVIVDDMKARSEAGKDGVPDGSRGKNPDGIEHALMVEEAEELLLTYAETVEKGQGMLEELLLWMDEVSPLLGLEIETGRTVTKDIIGNEFSRPKMSPLNRSTVIYGVMKQQQFINQQRNK